MKMARKALEGLEGVTWIEPSSRERAKVKDAFTESPVLDYLGITEDTDATVVRRLMDEGVRGHWVGEDGLVPGEEMEFAAGASRCAANTVRASLDRVFQLAEVDTARICERPSDPGQQFLIVEEAAGRAIDMKVLATTKKTGIAGSWAAATIAAAFGDKNFRQQHVQHALQARGRFVFGDERTGEQADEQKCRPLLMMRLQRTMARRMAAAPRKELIKALTADYRKKLGPATVSSVDDYEKIVTAFEELGQKELELRAEEARAETEVGITGAMTEASDSEAEPAAKRTRFDHGIQGAMTEASESESEVEIEVEITAPPTGVWRKWSAQQVFAYFARECKFRTDLTLKQQDDWEMDGQWLAACDKVEQVVAHQKGWSERLREELRRIFRPFFVRARFAEETKDSEGATKRLKPAGATMDTKYGELPERRFSAKDIAKRTELRKAWLNCHVLWLHQGRERLGKVVGSQVGSAVKFRIQPSHDEEGDFLWTIEQTVQGMEGYLDLVRDSQRSGDGDQLVATLREADRIGGGAREGPKEKMKQDKRTIDAILDAAALRYAGNNSERPLAFSKEGLRSGEDLRVLLNAVNVGGAETKKVVHSMMGQQVLRQAREDLRKHMSNPSDMDILYSVFGSRQLESLACFNVVTEEIQTKEKHVMVTEEGMLKLASKTPDKRVSKTISSKDQNNFALARWVACLRVVHGDALATQWYTSILKMQDDVMVKDTGTTVPQLQAVWRAAWQELTLKLEGAARRVEIQQLQMAVTDVHAGEEAGKVQVQLQNWDRRRVELVMEAKFQYMREFSADSSGRGGGKKQTGTGSGSPKKKQQKQKKQKGNGQSAEDRTMTRKLKEHGFKTLDEAKKEFREKAGNKRKCFWACSEVGQALGGCTFEECRFLDSHP